MTIKTKYNIGDCVWFMYENKPCFEQIGSISIRPTVRIFYNFSIGLTEISKLEKAVFSTKEELLKSL